MSEWRIPLSDLDYGPEEEEAVLRVIRSRWLSMGPEVQAFEREFADYLGVKHAVAVSNGTAALHLSYLALGLGSGDEIAQPAINFVAAANCAAAIGARPIFADICSLSEPTLDPEDLERKLTPRTRAVVVMHYGGYVGRIAAIRAICARHGLALIEDACHAIGARCYAPGEPAIHGRLAGTLGDVGCFSFFSNKNLATGEGGMVVTDRDDVAAQVRLLRSHGMTTLTWDRHRGHASTYDVVAHGFNYRLDEMRAALGRAQLAKLERNNQRRRELVRAYQYHLATLQNWLVPFISQQDSSACHLMVVVAPDPATRQAGARALRNQGIQTSLHYPYISDFAAFERYRSDRLELSRDFASRVLTLPAFPGMTEAQVEHVCAILKTTP